MSFSLPSALGRFQKGVLLFAIAMLLFSMARGLLLLRYPADFALLDPDLKLHAFANGLRFDGAVVARLFALPLLLWWLPLRYFEQRWWTLLWGWSLYLVTLLLLMLLIGDILYFEHVQRHVSYELLLLQNDLNFLLEFALKAHLAEIIAFTLFATGLAWLWWRILRLDNSRSHYASLKFLALFLVLAAVGRGGVSGKVIEIIDAYSSGDSAYGHLSLNGAFTTIVFALNMESVNHHFMPQAEAVQQVRNGEPLLDPEFPMLRHYPGKTNGHNVVFVLLESWNFDYVDSFAGGHYGATPYFDALAREGMKFSRFYAAGQRSIDGIQATLTGIPTLKGLPRIDTGIGVSNISRLGNLVKAKGYSTLFIQSSDRDSFKIQGIATAAGFDEFYGKEDVPLLLDYPDPTAAIFGWDHDTLQYMKGKLDDLPQPFLAYAFTGSTHEPYPPLPKAFMRYENEPNGEKGYLNALGYADWSIGQFIAEARKMPWFDNTVFIFTADHVNHLQTGEGEQRFHTPMLIYSPKWVAAGESDVIGSQLDVMPTILDLLGVDGEFAALGESLLRKANGGQAFVSYGGQHIGLITPEGFLRHDLQRALESRGLDGQMRPLVERRLLALDQISYELLHANRWAR